VRILQGSTMRRSDDVDPPSHEQFLALLEQKVTPQQFEMWFRRLSLTRVAEGKYRVAVPNEFIRNWIETYYAGTLENALRDFAGDGCTIELVVDASLESDRDARVPRPEALEAGNHVAPQDGPRPKPQLSPNSDTILHADYTFANFVVGASNKFAHAAAIAVADSPARNFNPFFLHGSVGLGKTHLLQAICHEILERAPRTNILYLSCESFINQFIEALENGDLNSFRQKYRNVDVLLVDDIQLLANKERTQEEFFHTFNTLYNLGHQIVLSSDAPPKDIPTLQERLVSRFKMGLVVEIAPPDFETRVNILRNKARLRGHDLPTDVSHYLAEHILTNIRELEGAICRLIGFADIDKRPITLPFTQEVLADSIGRRNAVITIHDIIAVVTKHYTVKLSDLQSKRRNQSLTFPRQVCMYLARKHTNHSLEEIGRYFGGRDHTTVLYATEKMDKRASADPNFLETLRHLTRELAI
jgi:chromosomal replication initiator protein